MRLRAAAPEAVIEERFLGPADLARIFSSTALNFHPPLYDAYGMTVVEAASQGAHLIVAARERSLAGVKIRCALPPMNMYC